MITMPARSIRSRMRLCENAKNPICVSNGEGGGIAATGYAAAQTIINPKNKRPPRASMSPSKTEIIKAKCGKNKINNTER